MRLVWGDGDGVEIQRQGLAPEQATFAISEGETEIVTGDLTYFYISDREAAHLELLDFDDAGFHHGLLAGRPRARRHDCTALHALS